MKQGMILAAAMMLVLALGACGEEGIGVQPGNGDDPITEPGDDGEADNDASDVDDEEGIGGGTLPGEGERVRGEPRDDVRDATPAEVESAEVDGEAVTLIWWDGVEDCNGLDSVDVEEGADEVTVTVRTGAVGPEDQACIMIALEWETTITLDEPLGDRALVDGSTGEEIPY